MRLPPFRRTTHLPLKHSVGAATTETISSKVCEQRATNSFQLFLVEGSNPVQKTLAGVQLAN